MKKEKIKIKTKSGKRYTQTFWIMVNELLKAHVKTLEEISEEYNLKKNRILSHVRKSNITKRQQEIIEKINNPCEICSKPATTFYESRPMCSIHFGEQKIIQRYIENNQNKPKFEVIDVMNRINRDISKKPLFMPENVSRGEL